MNTYNQRYSYPNQMTVFVDVNTNSVVNKKDITLADQLRITAEKNGDKTIIRDPLKSCKKCYGTGRNGYKNNIPVPCRCMFRDDPSYKMTLNKR